MTQPTPPQGGSAPAMTQLRCRGCNRRFGKRARAVLLFETYLVCRECAFDVTMHRKLFRGCPETHGLRSHGGDVVSIGVARQALAMSQQQAKLQP
jgi:hypothetical protein